MLAAQYGLELKLLLRNGEQLLLTMFIPITLLVGLTLLPIGSLGDHRPGTFTRRSWRWRSSRRRSPGKPLPSHSTAGTAL